MVFGSRAVVMEMGESDFEHKGTATSDRVVGMGVRVGVHIVIGEV